MSITLTFQYINGNNETLTFNNYDFNFYDIELHLLKVYEETSILYAQLSHNFLYAVQSKLYEYLASGKYIIYGGCGEASLVMYKFENNKVINPDNVEELSKAIKESLENENYKKISTFNREKIYSAYLREKCVSDLFNFIENN